MGTSDTSASGLRLKTTWSRRFKVICLGVAIGFIVGECSLRILGIPRFYKAHSAPLQFTVFYNDKNDVHFVNSVSTNIVFAYDSNPRGYFKSGNIVEHKTNAHGFRGPEFKLPKPARTMRLGFLGDSFTFGEGVHFQDTFAEVTAKLLAERCAASNINFESLNFGVSGYNTADELFLLRELVLRQQVDVIVLCYVLNDAEPPLMTVDSTNKAIRRPRELDVLEGGDQIHPPDTWLYMSHIAQLAWRASRTRRLNQQTEAYYLGLYRPDAPDWLVTRTALHDFVQTCTRESIPLVVMSFPVLWQLDDNHPFQGLYQLIGNEVEQAGGKSLDLFPSFRGQSAAALWVHPTDQHPNEIGHRIAAEQLCDCLLSMVEVRAKIEKIRQ